MPLPYRTLWSYIRYTLYFIAYTPFRLPRSPRPTPVSRIPTSNPLFGGCMHLAFLEARILCRWRSHSASSLSLSISLSVSLCPGSRTHHTRAPMSRGLFSGAARFRSSPPAARQKRNIFPGHYFYRAAVRELRPAILSAN